MGVALSFATKKFLGKYNLAVMLWCNRYMVGGVDSCGGGMWMGETVVGCRTE